jgi:hypothetical protein
LNNLVYEASKIIPTMAVNNKRKPKRARVLFTYKSINKAARKVKTNKIIKIHFKIVIVESVQRD